MTSKERYQRDKEKQKARSLKRHWAKRDEILAWKRLNKDRLYAATKEKQAKWQKESVASNKKIVVNHYSNGTSSCSCCDEKYIEFLTVDHINGGGVAHRKSIKGNFYHWLIANNFPDGFRILCMNCNFSLGKFKYCPHTGAN